MGENRLCVAQFDYQPQRVDELQLTKGDLVKVVEDVEDGWARGEVIRFKLDFPIGRGRHSGSRSHPDPEIIR